ncbi:hypothetical protein PR202_ga30576 [Eleusine coracana subsp. coracana]|uniref:Pep3/Vps18 beta-propeller domain-containing protein n=1 Tax=Eleusine coracana subsp. coracana TaxID=191504 RepID=A0AAV5DPS6_ELECO|nr:hypothetical protein PR202_ga30576 [Eleusine coracana subsp. coracana]
MDASGQLFSVDPLERHAARGHGVVTSMAAGSDVIVLGTSRGWLVRHDFSFEDAHDLDLGAGRSGDHSVHRVFLDPGGKHCIATMVHQGGAETYYHHARWPRPKLLPRLRGLLVNAVAWNRQSITEASTKEVILGTETGQIFEMAVDEADKREKYVKPLFELTEQKEGIKALQMETAVVGNAMRYYVMAVTPTRLYSFTGIGSLEVVNRISQRVVEELVVDNTPETSRGIIGLCSDASTGLFYAYDESSIFQVSTSDEGRDMWQVYLDMNNYAAALSHCCNPFQRDQVYLVQVTFICHDACGHADAAFAAKEFYIAASFYAKMNYILSFEEISLKFIAIGEQDALRTFLLRRLDNLTKDDKMQITMISTWVTELYLDKINRLLLEDSTATATNALAEPSNSEYRSIVNEFRAFLSDSKDVLDEATTMRLLESYGRVDELVYFAALKEQYEIVVHHYIQQGEARKALEVLQRRNVPVDLVYKFAPDLIMLDAYETVESWMMARNKLNPGKLIPAMMRYVSEPHAKNETHEVIKYLEFCVKDLDNEDPGVHNLLLSLYAKKVDLELAKAEADKVEDDEELRKKLWLKVAKHVIEQEKGVKRENIKKAIEFLSETNNLLKIEDILPFFPDFVLIDDFKEEICKSLKDYNSQIDQLKQEMDDATRGADNIRSDIGALAQRYTVIDREQDCGAERILDLQKQLSLIDRKAAKDNGASVNGESIMSVTPVDKLRLQLDDAVASECPFCGDMMIKEILQPFILPEESEEKASWEIKPQPNSKKILQTIYVAGFAWSWGPLGWLVPSEVFSLEIRSAGQSIAVCVNMTLTFIIGQSFLTMLCHLKFGLFYFFAAWMLVMTTFIALFLPETKGVAIEEMQQVWSRHWFWGKYVAGSDHGGSNRRTIV